MQFQNKTVSMYFLENTLLLEREYLMPLFLVVQDNSIPENGIYSTSWGLACYLTLHSSIMVLYLKYISSILPLVIFPVFSSITQQEYLMSTLTFLLCVYQICSKLLKVLVYLAQNFLVLKYTVLQTSQYCSKVFHYTTKMEGIIFLRKNILTHLKFLNSNQQ